MNIPKELIEQWLRDRNGYQSSATDYEQYIAQRAAEWALSQPVSMEPKCVAVIDVFDKEWHMKYLSLPVGTHKLYAQQYIYTEQEQSNGRRDDLRSDLHSDISQRGCSDNSVADKTLLPVSMEPVAWTGTRASIPHLTSSRAIAEREADLYTIPLYTATQLAAARQQGAEEERKKWGWLYEQQEDHERLELAMSKRIADLEKSNAVLLEALKELVDGFDWHDTKADKARAAITEVKP